MTILSLIGIPLIIVDYKAYSEENAIEAGYICGFFSAILWGSLNFCTFVLVICWGILITVFRDKDKGLFFNIQYI